MLYTATYYMPCRQCGEVKLVETVLVAELTEAVQRAITAGTVCETVCDGCDARLSPSLPILLCTPESDMTVVYSPPDGDEPDLDFAALVVAESGAPANVSAKGALPISALLGLTRCGGPG